VEAARAAAEGQLVRKAGAFAGINDTSTTPISLRRFWPMPRDRDPPASGMLRSQLRLAVPGHQQKRAAMMVLR